MSTRRGVVTALVLGAVGAGGFALLRSGTPDDAEAAIDRRSVTGPPLSPSPTETPAVDDEALGRALDDARFIAVGGGAWPEATQVQIEQDVGLFTEVLGEGGVVLFGAGAGAPVVQVQRPTIERDPVGTALSDLFAPRGGRDATYRAPTIEVDAEATAERVTEAFERATSRQGDPLLVFIAGHGEMGATPRDNLVSLWAGSSITAATLAKALDRAKRPVRLVVTTCFSGGFAELAFADADEKNGAPAVLRCGLFASTWDLEASGCDPNPNRNAQQGYAMHFLNALRGRDRDGAALATATLDADGDGVVGLLDAHTRVRIASDGADVPTTTSERWLRARAPATGPSAAVATPEEDAVIAALAERLGFVGREADAVDKLAELERAIAIDEDAIERTHLAEDAAYRAVAAELLARWPILDDPWHPDFATLFRGQRAEIGELLESSSSYKAYLAAREAAAAAQTERGDHIALAAPIERLVRAHETKALAGRLAAQGGDAFETWQALIACERWSPQIEGRSRAER